MPLTPEQEAELTRLKGVADSERRHITDGDAGDSAEGVGPAAEEPADELYYEGIEPASADESADEGDRQEIITAFVVFINAEGKAIATSEIDKVLAETKRRREADIEDFRRACTEVAQDCQTLIQTQSVINTQMQMAARMQEAQKNEQLLAQMQQGMPLNRARRRAAR